MGYQWYQLGKYEHKMNTYLDTKACISFLVEKGVTKRGMVALKGRSAGGIVAGNAIVDQDSLADVVIAHVPFIDPVYDLLDSTVPWTAYEWYHSLFMLGMNGVIHKMHQFWKP